MKTKNAVIAILAVVVLGQFFLLVRQGRIQWYVDRVTRKPRVIPIDVYVAKATECFSQSSRTSAELHAQATWALRHLGQCIKLLEEERGLEPIPMKSGHEDPNYPMMPPGPPYERESGPFCLSYEKPSHCNDAYYHNEENDLAKLVSLLNTNTLFIRMSSYVKEQQIRNYEERLQRLDPNSIQENSENLSR